MEKNEKEQMNRMLINKRFLISKLIQETAHSSVYLGIDKKTNTKIAIKIVTRKNLKIKSLSILKQEEITHEGTKSKSFNQIIKKGLIFKYLFFFKREINK